MIRKIVYRYKFASLSNIDLLVQECESHLVTILGKFDIKKGYKAFSYFSVITKNWFSHAAKKSAGQIKNETLCEKLSKTIENEYLSTTNNYIEERMFKEFIEALWEEINRWELLELKPNEMRVLKAIKILLLDPEHINNTNGILRKKAINVYLREITNLSTKQIFCNMSRFKILYAEFVSKWHNEE